MLCLLIQIEIHVTLLITDTIGEMYVEWDAQTPIDIELHTAGAKAEDVLWLYSAGETFASSRFINFVGNPLFLTDLVKSKE